MAEKPILFSGAMVRAVIKGSKTQTRRVVKPYPDDCERIEVAFDDKQRLAAICACEERGDGWIYCPYGKPGDRLWVRETFLLRNAGNTVVYRAAIEQSHGIPEAAGFGAMYGGWKPSIFMPRWASRLTLEITAVRVERVQEISEEDAKAEGIQVLPLQVESDPSAWYQSAPGVHQERSAKASFHALWDSINSKRGFGWEKNPWVWAISFRKAEAHAH